MDTLRLEIASPHVLSRLLETPTQFYEKVSIDCMQKIELEPLLKYLSTQPHLCFVRLHSIYSELPHYQRLANAIVEHINWVEHVELSAHFYRQDSSSLFRVVYRLHPAFSTAAPPASLSQKSSPEFEPPTLKVLKSKMIAKGASGIQLRAIKRLEFAPPPMASKCFAYRILRDTHSLQSLTLSALHIKSLQRTLSVVRTNTSIRSLKLHRCKLSALNLSGNTTLTHLHLQDSRVNVLDESDFALPLSLVSLGMKNIDWKGRIHARYFEPLTSLEVLAIGDSFSKSEDFHTVVASYIRDSPSLHTLRYHFPKLRSAQVNRMYTAILHRPTRWTDLNLNPNPDFVMLNRLSLACTNLHSLRARSIIARSIHCLLEVSFSESLLRLEFNFDSYTDEQKNAAKSYVSACHERLACHPNILSCHFSQIVYGLPIHTLSYETPEYVEKNAHNHRLRQHTLVSLLYNPNHLFPKPSTPSVYSN